MSKLSQLADLGQSIWLDYIQRSLIDSGGLQSWIDRGLRGVTSNPSIFKKAIVDSADYDRDLRVLVEEGKSVSGIYEALALDDIARAADLLRPVYETTKGLDGYVSLEVDPVLADDTAGTIADVRRFHKLLGRPNVMFKVPATPAGIPAIEELVGSGININVTLIFALNQYEAVIRAFISGLQRWASSGGDPAQVASVASFFVSRVDTAVDRALEELGKRDLQGKIAVANAKVAYAIAAEIYAQPDWQELAARGARVQRLLWASTSTKNPAYPDIKYVQELIGPDTVNTVPPDTLALFIDHGTVTPTLEIGTDDARADLEQLAELGIDLQAITDKLLAQGVTAFADAYNDMLDSIEQKRKQLLRQGSDIELHVDVFESQIESALRKISQENVIGRIWNHDHTVWKPTPDEITNRLGWLDIAGRMMDNIECIDALVEDVRAEGYTRVLLLGMGGSSLAPEVFYRTFGHRDGYLDLEVLDMTDPAAVLAHAECLPAPEELNGETARREGLDPGQTLFIVATKSGGTVETLSFFKYFYNWTAKAVGIENAGQHFIAITDPGSRLDTLAQEYDFRATFRNDPNIGGRYSALSYFGLVPAALIGVDLPALLDRAQAISYNCETCNWTEGSADNSGALLGTALGVLAPARHDKLTLVLSPAIASLGDWIEQLVAESTGKEGRSIVPVVGEPLGEPEVYGQDRTFVYLCLNGDNTYDKPIQRLQDAGFPVIHIRLRDKLDIGQQFFLWEMATAVASHYMNINPFDQPNVEAAKVRAREMVAAYTENGALPHGDASELTREALIAFLDQAGPGTYVALHVYLRPTERRTAALQVLRTRIRDRYHVATTVGYGPRFLHSTGQLHKGDAGNGIFVQITDESVQDVPIPDEAGETSSSVSFGILEEAQALGDQKALLDAGRRVIRFHLGTDVIGNLTRMSEMLD